VYDIDIEKQSHTSDYDTYLLKFTLKQSVSGYHEINNLKVILATKDKTYVKKLGSWKMNVLDQQENKDISVVKGNLMIERDIQGDIYTLKYTVKNSSNSSVNLKSFHINKEENVELLKNGLIEKELG